MAKNKIVYDGNVLIDLSQDTVSSAADIVAGKIGHLRDGTQVTGTASGGGCTVDVKTVTPSSNATSISFTGLSAEPKMFCVQWEYNNGSYMSGSSTRYITSVCSDGEHCYGSSVYRSGSSGREYYYTTASFSYSNGTLTITSPSSSTLGYFRSGYTYRLIYAY